jgi:hypothetical protein
MELTGINPSIPMPLHLNALVYFKKTTPERAVKKDI